MNEMADEAIAICEINKQSTVIRRRLQLHTVASISLKMFSLQSVQ